MILMYILSFQANFKANALRKSGCPSYDKLQQLFASNAAIGAYQNSSNTPTPDSDEECALEEEIAKMIPLLQSKPNVRTNVPLKSLLARGRRLTKKRIGLVT